MSSCQRCGADQPEGARFCNGCGAPMGAPVCASCGERLVPGARFCNGCGAAQGVAPVTPPPVAARRVTSVLFGDLVGFTTLSERRDQEEVRELLSRYFEECRQVVGRYGGTVEKFIGDAVMAVWGVPTAHEDDAERSVRAGLELVTAVTALGEDVGTPDLAMRVGIVTGEVAVTLGAQQQGMVAGDPVNTASRVQSVAAPGQVWVDETTRLLTSSAITYVDVGSHLLKGKAEPLPLWAVRAVVAARGGAQRADGLEAPLVGRDRELRLVKELFHVAEESGRPSLVVVEGDPGVGKSRLAWEFEKYVDGLTSGVRWHSGRCLAYGEGVAFYALADAFRGRLIAAVPETDAEEELDPERLLDQGLDRWVPDADERAWMRPRLGVLLGSRASESFAREDLFSAWATFLERVGTGETVVLVVDDAQHADEGLLGFLEHLLAVATFPCFLVLLTRPGLLDAHPRLATNRRATVLHLPTLSEADMAVLLDGLVAGLPGEVRAGLVEKAEGVPLFAVETIRSLIDRDLVVPRGGQYVLADGAGIDLHALGAPASLQALISARLDTLSAEQRRVVDRGSVLGESFRRDEIAALVPEVQDLDRMLGELVRQQILSRESSRLSAEYGQFRFVQSVVRQVAYSTLSRRDRKAVHLRVIDLLLAEADASEDVVPMLAQHYLDALEAAPDDDDVPQLRERAIAQLERAAARAAGLGSPTEAAGHLAEALGRATDRATRARLQSDLADALRRGGQYDEAGRHAAEATESFDALGDDLGAGLAAARHALTLATLGDCEAALGIAEPRWEALLGRPDADAVLLALTEAMSTSMLRLARDPREILEARLRLAERLGAVDATADAYIALYVYYSINGPRSLARLLLLAGADLARREHRPTVLARALINLCVDNAGDDLAEAERHGREALSVAHSTGNPNWVSFAKVNLVLTLLRAGAWDDLQDLLTEDDEEPVNVAAYEGARILLCEARGEPWSLPWDPDDRPHVDDTATVAWQLHCESRALLAQGSGAEGVRRALECVETAARAMGDSDDFPILWVNAAEAAVRLGEAPVATRLLEMAGEDGDRAALELVGHRARLRALWAMLTGRDTEQVEPLLRTAADCYARWGSRLHRARAQADLGVWLTDLGRSEEAGPLLEEARAVLADLGATAWLAQLDDRLVTVG